MLMPSWKTAAKLASFKEYRIATSIRVIASEATEYTASSRITARRAETTNAIVSISRIVLILAPIFVVCFRSYYQVTLIS
jgi:hypothetical protein